MKVVIEIPDKMVKAIEDGSFGYRYNIYDLCGLVMDGTPLPKGHGRLIDADEIQFENTEFETYGDYCIAFDAIDDAPTIIEKDGD